MQLGEGGAASAQRLTDRGGERQGGELGHPEHTNLHTNLLHSVHARARSTATTSRERSVAVQEELFSYPSVCAEPGGGARRACAVRVLLEGLHVQHRAEHL